MLGEAWSEHRSGVFVPLHPRSKARGGEERVPKLEIGQRPRGRPRLPRGALPELRVKRDQGEKPLKVGISL